MKDKNKPKAPKHAYACFIQTCRKDMQQEHLDSCHTFADLSKLCANRWKTMTPLQKLPFQEQADLDKVRYLAEMAMYTGSAETSSGVNKKKGKKKPKDPNAPRPPMTSFFWFSNDQGPQVRKDNPDLRPAESAKVLGKMWKELAEEVKMRYKIMADRDKARYDRECREYYASQQSPRLPLIPQSQPVVQVHGINGRVDINGIVSNNWSQIYVFR